MPHYKAIYSTGPAVAAIAVGNKLFKEIWWLGTLLRLRLSLILILISLTFQLTILI